MSLTVALAIYGAILSTGLAGWTVYTWVRGNWTRVRIAVSVDYLRPLTDGEFKPGAYITVVNDSHHTVRLIGLGYESTERRRKRSMGWVFPEALPPSAKTPAEIKSRDAFTTWLPRHYLEGWFHNGRGNIRLRAQLATGQIIKTGVLTPKSVTGYRSWPDQLLGILDSAAKARIASAADNNTST